MQFVTIFQGNFAFFPALVTQKSDFMPQNKKSKKCHLFLVDNLDGPFLIGLDMRGLDDNTKIPCSKFPSQLVDLIDCSLIIYPGVRDGLGPLRRTPLRHCARGHYALSQ